MFMEKSALTQQKVSLDSHVNAKPSQLAKLLKNVFTFLIFFLILIFLYI